MRRVAFPDNSVPTIYFNHVEFIRAVVPDLSTSLADPQQYRTTIELGLFEPFRLLYGNCRDHLVEKRSLDSGALFQKYGPVKVEVDTADVFKAVEKRQLQQIEKLRKAIWPEINKIASPGEDYPAAPGAPLSRIESARRRVLFPFWANLKDTNMIESEDEERVWKLVAPAQIVSKGLPSLEVQLVTVAQCLTTACQSGYVVQNLADPKPEDLLHQWSGPVTPPTYGHLVTKKLFPDGTISVGVPGMEETKVMLHKFSPPAFVKEILRQATKQKEFQVGWISLFGIIGRGPLARSSRTGYYYSVCDTLLHSGQRLLVYISLVVQDFPVRGSIQLSETRPEKRDFSSNETIDSSFDEEKIFKRAIDSFVLATHDARSDCVCERSLVLHTLSVSVCERNLAPP